MSNQSYTSSKHVNFEQVHTSQTLLRHMANMVLQPCEHVPEQMKGLQHAQTTIGINLHFAKMQKNSISYVNVNQLHMSMRGFGRE